MWEVGPLTSVQGSGRESGRQWSCAADGRRKAGGSRRKQETSGGEDDQEERWLRWEGEGAG